MKLNLLEKSILATVVYYDALDYPLTGFEVFKYLINPLHIMAQSGTSRSQKLEPMAEISYLNILKALKNLSNHIEEKNGFYFLKRRKELYKIRISRQKFSDQKWRKARKIIKLLQAIPYIKMVLLSGSVAFGNAKKQSDIDLLIVAKHKRIWTVRILVTFFIHITGKRRYGNKTSDRICLNHYITNESLKIDFPSLYNAQTYVHLVPVLETERTCLGLQNGADTRQGLYKKFQKANQWIKNYLANYFEQETDDRRLIKEKKILREIAKLQEFILNTFLGNILEKAFKIIQKKRIKGRASKDKGEGRIITDDFQLEFHPDSPESKVIDKYNKNMLKLDFRINPEQNSGLH